MRTSSGIIPLILAELEITRPPPKAAPKPSTSRTTAAESAQGLTISAGFDWSGVGPTSDAEFSGTSSEDDDVPPHPKGSSNAKGKSRAINDLTATAPDSRPESVTDFERALLASPNSSFLWIQYMSFQLQLHEVDKARRIGRQALERIAYREEEEKLNMWMAMVNLELGFGSEESLEKVFKEAAQYNDARTVYSRYAEALQEAGKEEVS